MIVDLSDGGYGAAWIPNSGTLIDAKSRLQSIDAVDVGPLQLIEKLAGVN